VVDADGDLHDFNRFEEVCKHGVLACLGDRIIRIEAHISMKLCGFVKLS